MMNRILAFTLAILLVLPVNLAWGQSDEGYGEDETALGQFVDSFETSGNISVAVDVIRNSTLEVMELNSTTSPKVVIQNLTQLREHDYYGGAATPDYTFNIVGNDEIRMISTAGSQGRGYMFLTVEREWFDDKYVRFRYYPYCDVVNPAYQWHYFSVYDGEYNRSDNTDFPNTLGGAPWNPIPTKGNGVLYSYTNIDGLNSWFTKDFQVDTSGGSEGNVTLFWWSNDAWAARVLGYYLDWIEINVGAGGTDNIIRINFNDSSPITIEQAGTQGDYGFSLNPELPFEVGGFFPEGYFSTVDYLSDPLANGSALVSMVNTSIPANTQILLQFSDDNATWGDAEGVPLDSIVLNGGFESFDLRDLNYSTGYYSRFNLSTSNSSVTPRVYQNRLITTIGQDARNILNGSWVYYNLTAILNITGVHDTGTVASTYFIDGNTWNCSEVVGAPGYIVNFNVTGIDTEAISLWLVNYVYYDGISAHHIHVEAWNFTAPGWVEIGIIDDDVGFEWHNYTVYEMRIPNDFVNSTGAFVGRFNHVDAGNINDDIMFERINLLAFVPTVSAVAGVGAGANWGLLWFFLILICIPILLVLGKGSKR